MSNHVHEVGQVVADENGKHTESIKATGDGALHGGTIWRKQKTVSPEIPSNRINSIKK